VNEVTARRRRLRRIWRRAGIACVVLLAAAVALPRVQRAMDPTPMHDSRGGNRALWWWCGILTATVLAGAVAQTASVKFGDDDEDRL
jgi:hypothetical protein